ncbi:hypothetical protein B5V00_11480 [Geothermobacter hydrogeniphilus]|uniref:Hydrogenase maturation protease n=2 Tax=Geothermobacter hydrogeniphilus TaxID=1969733 RepID=A0A1X0Y0S4_9BACT|nr:hypothetical protein B5V00_11480 [Geothermobacter hydrogeniphilus]
MGDDGIGVAVAERLAGERLSPGVAVVEAGTVGLGLLDLWRGYERVWLVDAVRMGRSPGSWCWLDAADLLRLKPGGFDAHAGLAGALQLAMALGALPPGFGLLAVEPGSVERRMGLSMAGCRGVAAALAELRRRLECGE